jgi:peptidoglycan L-alanyl-D-glutamate endopeptidase CwlK
MPFFSEISKKRLSTCHEDLQLICHNAINDVDFSVLCGHRSVKEQFDLFTKGRKLINGVWQVADRKKIVTNLDGKTKKSKHNEYPSMAVDIAPWPIDWKNEQRFFVLANRMEAISNFLYNTDKTKHRLFWGGNWNMRDYPHFQLWEVEK